MTTSRRLPLSSLAACTDYDFEIVPWIDDYMAEDDKETAEVHRNLCKVACSKIKKNYKLPYVLGSLLVPLKDRS